MIRSMCCRQIGYYLTIKQPGGEYFRNEHVVEPHVGVAGREGEAALRGMQHAIAVRVANRQRRNATGMTRRTPRFKRTSAANDSSATQSTVSPGR